MRPGSRALHSLADSLLHVLSSLSKHLDIPGQITLSLRGLGLIIRQDLTTKKHLVRRPDSEVFLSEAFSSSRLSFPPAFYVIFLLFLLVLIFGY